MLLYEFGTIEFTIAHPCESNHCYFITPRDFFANPLEYAHFILPYRYFFSRRSHSSSGIELLRKDAYFS